MAKKVAKKKASRSGARKATKSRSKSAGGKVYRPRAGASEEEPVEATKATRAGGEFRGRRSVGAFTTAGGIGTAIYGGYLSDVETNAALRGRKKFTTFDELFRNVAIVAASVRYLFNVIGKAEWTFNPAKDTGNDRLAQEVADFVEDALHDMTTPFHRVVKRGATFFTHGFSWQEWTAKRRDDGRIGLLDVEARVQKTIDRWDCDESGTVIGVGQRIDHGADELYIPRAKSLYVVDDTFTDSPEGLGVLRHAYPAAKRLERYEQLEGIGYETDLRGVPKVRAPYAEMKDAGLSDSQVAERVKFLEDFSKSHVRSEASGLVLDSITYDDDEGKPSNVPLWDAELMSSSTSSADAVGKAIDRVIWHLAIMFGTEGLLVGRSGAGSLAMSKDKSSNSGLIVDACLSEVAPALNRDIVGVLCRLNGIPREFWPKALPEKLQQTELVDVADTLRAIAQAGAPLMPDDPAINAVRRLIGLPEVDLSAVDLDASLRGRDDEDGEDEDDVDDPDDRDADDAEDEDEET